MLQFICCAAFLQKRIGRINKKLSTQCSLCCTVVG